MKNISLPGFAVHPGEILAEDFMKPLGLTQKALAERLKISFRRVNEICRGRRAVTADTSLLLGKAFGTGPEFWMNLQSLYELAIAKPNSNLKSIRPFKKSA